MEPINGTFPAVAPLAGLAGVTTGQHSAHPLQEAPPVPPARLDDVVKELNRTMSVINTSISFSIDQGTGKTVIKVMEAGTDKLIRQIPAEDMLRIAARLNELLGLVYDEKR